MKTKMFILIISAAFIMSSFAVAGMTIINEDVPQPYAGKITVAAPELLEGPEVSTTKTIQDGDVSPVTEKLINQGVIPAAVDKKAQEVAVPSN
jgi:hypothetical protein